MNDTTAGAAWLELLADCSDLMFRGSSAEEVEESGLTGAEATARYAICAATGTERLAEALDSPWALRTPAQVGAVAAALTAAQHHAELAKRRLAVLLAGMAERGESGPVPPALAGLLAAAPSPEAAERVFGEIAALRAPRPVPETLAGALRGAAELLADLLVPEPDAIEVFGAPGEPDHQGWARLRHGGKEWRLFFHVHDEDEWFLDDYPAEPGTKLPLGFYSAASAHPAQLAEAARTALEKWAAEQP
ncbi:hypothetical protein [Kitasatospora sp. NPDC057198]|uniref:hypothetical protein n=1 Tax=Kitasatospora sp. NPDC057198 TaxID=3346046 RepID=UPI003632D628